MNPSAPRVSVVIVTWNSRDEIGRCLDSIERSAVPTEIIVADNGSTDGTPALLRARYPRVMLLEGHGNIGFPAANNLALRHASSELVLFLNPDTELHEGTLETCVAELDAKADVGVVGCRLLFEDGSTQLESARRAYRLGDLLIESVWLHMFFPRHPLFGRQLLGDWDHLGDRDVEAISGAFMLARRSVVEQVGGLPEEVFMYHEDLAFCLRVWRAGWRIRYLAGVTATHFAGRSSGQSSAALYLLEGEYKRLLIRELQGPLYGAAVRPVILARSLLRLGISIPGRILPGLGPLRRRFPKVFHVRMHWDQLVWSLRPGWAHRLPRRADGVAGSAGQS